MAIHLTRADGRVAFVWTLAWFTGAAAAFGQEPAAAADGRTATPAPATTENELQSLNELAGTWLRSKLRYEQAATPAERKALKHTAATVAFAEAMARYDADRSQPLLVDAEALRQTFANVLIPDATPTAVGTTAFVTEANRMWAEFVPTDYDNAKPHPTILVIGDRDARASQESLQQYLSTTWLAAEAGNPPILVAPMAPTELDFDAIPDEATGKATAQPEEDAKIGAILAPLGGAMRKLHVDRDRIILDCGRGASAFGLRLAANFPDRFAGVILRWPVLDEGVRLEALTGLPILLLRCAATETACNSLRTRLNELAEGSCYVLTPRDDYPFAGEVGIVEWARQQHREVMATKVVVAPSSDRFRLNRWARIEIADPVDPDRLDDGPRLTAEVDREHNRITVTTRGVKTFSLLLGPALVDVRKFTLVVNGTEETVTREPSLKSLVDYIMNRSDAGWLFTAVYRGTVPKRDH